jgi:hypothetical protein
MTSTANTKNSLLTAIAITGFIAGLLDIIAACTSYYISSGNGPMNVLLYISCGALGTDAFSGGLPIALLGLVFHFVIAYLFTIIFFAAYPKINLLAKNKIIAGLLYGLVVWVIMNQVVLPLSKVPQSPFLLAEAIKGALILMFAVGLPISLGAHRYYSKQKSS